MSSGTLVRTARFAGGNAIPAIIAVIAAVIGIVVGLILGLGLAAGNERFIRIDYFFVCHAYSFEWKSPLETSIKDGCEGPINKDGNPDANVIDLVREVVVAVFGLHVLKEDDGDKCEVGVTDSASPKFGVAREYGEESPSRGCLCLIEREPAVESLTVHPLDIVSHHEGDQERLNEYGCLHLLPIND